MKDWPTNRVRQAAVARDTKQIMILRVHARRNETNSFLTTITIDKKCETLYWPRKTWEDWAQTALSYLDAGLNLQPNCWHRVTWAIDELLTTAALDTLRWIARSMSSFPRTFTYLSGLITTSISQAPSARKFSSSAKALLVPVKKWNVTDLGWERKEKAPERNKRKPRNTILDTKTDLELRTKTSTTMLEI